MPSAQSTNLATLRDQLQELQANFAKQAPEEVCRLMQEKTDELIHSGIAERSLHVGDKAPEFELPSARGASVRLSVLLDQEPVVLNFYRGGWCPYCNLELRAFGEALPEIERCGAKLVAISPETPDYASKTANQQALEFEVLSDRDNRVASQFGLVFTLPEEIRGLYEKFGIDIAAHNGNHDFQLPIPATYVIDQQGTIRFAFVTADYTQRAEPADVIEVLKQL